VSNSRIAYIVRILAAILLIGLEFTNLFPFIARGGNVPNTDPSSAFIPEFATYGVCILIFMLDTRSAARLVKKPIFIWAVATVGLFTWGMLIRIFNTPAGIEYYSFWHEFGLAVNAIAFLVSCVLIFDQAKVSAIARRAIVIATIAGVLLNIYDLMNPGTFSVLPGRGAGLYVMPNGAGIAMVLGCVTGLPSLRRGWSRDSFVLLCFIGVLTSFSRTAIIAFILLLIIAAFARELSLARISLAIGGAVVMILSLHLARNLKEERIVNLDFGVTQAFRLYADRSVEERSKLAQDAVAEFEEAPLLGHGFGTTAYWEQAPSHSYFLLLTADYGVVGLLLIPGLVLSVRRRNWEYYAFAAIYLVWAFFSHTVLTDPFGLICLAIEADAASMPNIRGRFADVNSAALLRFEPIRLVP
jgi:O-Antigen ligase